LIEKFAKSMRGFTVNDCNKEIVIDINLCLPGQVRPKTAGFKLRVFARRWSKRMKLGIRTSTNLLDGLKILTGD
jgi:hypothetical protein